MVMPTMTTMTSMAAPMTIPSTVPNMMAPHMIAPQLLQQHI